MKKTIFIVVSISLLLCATAFAGNLPTPVLGQMVTVDFEIFNYPSGENTNTRLFIRNLGLEDILLVDVWLFDPDGHHIIFNVGTEDSYSDLLDPVYGGSILLEQYASTSFSVTTEMLATSTYPVPTEHSGGRYFYFIHWYAVGDTPVVPPEIWGIHRAVYSPRTERDANIRYSFERWEGRVIWER